MKKVFLLCFAFCWARVIALSVKVSDATIGATPYVYVYSLLVHHSNKNESWYFTTTLTDWTLKNCTTTFQHVQYNTNCTLDNSSAKNTSIQINLPKQFFAMAQPLNMQYWLLNSYLTPDNYFGKNQFQKYYPSEHQYFDENIINFTLCCYNNPNLPEEKIVNYTLKMTHDHLDYLINETQSFDTVINYAATAQIDYQQENQINFELAFTPINPIPKNALLIVSLEYDGNVYQNETQWGFPQIKYNNKTQNHSANAINSNSISFNISEFEIFQEAFISRTVIINISNIIVPSKVSELSYRLIAMNELNMRIYEWNPAIIPEKRLKIDKLETKSTSQSFVGNQSGTNQTISLNVSRKDIDFSEASNVQLYVQLRLVIIILGVTSLLFALMCIYLCTKVKQLQSQKNQESLKHLGDDDKTDVDIEHA